jgi:hypothetical protein
MSSTAGDGAGQGRGRFRKRFLGEKPAFEVDVEPLEASTISSLPFISGSSSGRASTSPASRIPYGY